MIKAIFGFKRRPGMSHREFRDYRQNVHAPLLFAIPEAARIRRFAVSYPLLEPDSAEPRFDALVEAWFDSVADMDAFYLSDNFRTKVAPDHAHFIDLGSGMKLVTEEIVDREASTTAEPQRRFYHGTRADLRPGDRIAVGYQSNFGTGKPLSWVYFSATLDAATWGAELAAGSGPGRIYIVEPTGPYVDDPNLTDKKFPGNPTQSYRSRAPLRVTGEILGWVGHPPELLQQMKANVERLRQEGAEIID